MVQLYDNNRGAFVEGQGSDFQRVAQSVAVDEERSEKGRVPLHLQQT